jgi:hypothetical protein
VSEMTHEQALAHFGVKGMRWGQHKTTVKKPPTRAEVQARVAKIDKAVRLTALGAAAIITFGPGIMRASHIIAGHVVNAKVASNGAKFAAAMFSDSNGIGNHKIIDLGFSAASGTWG